MGDVVFVSKMINITFPELKKLNLTLRVPLFNFLTISGSGGVRLWKHKPKKVELMSHSFDTVDCGFFEGMVVKDVKIYLIPPPSIDGTLKRMPEGEVLDFIYEQEVIELIPDSF